MLMCNAANTKDIQAIILSIVTLHLHYTNKNDQITLKTCTQKKEPLAYNCVLSFGLSFFIINTFWIFVLY